MKKSIMLLVFVSTILVATSQSQILERMYHSLRAPVIHVDGNVTVDIHFLTTGAFFTIEPVEGVTVELIPDEYSTSGKDGDGNLFIFSFRSDRNVSCQIQLICDFNQQGPLFNFHLFEIIERNHNNGFLYFSQPERREIYDPIIVMIDYGEGLKDIWARYLRELEFGMIYSTFNFPDLLEKRVKDISTDEINITEIPRLHPRLDTLIPGEFLFIGHADENYIGPLFRFYDPTEGPLLHNRYEGYWAMNTSR